MIAVHEYRPEQGAEWKRFLEASNNGTLFHDLDFLSYHPEGKFTTKHLVFTEEEYWVGLLPAAVVVEGDGRRLLKSPYGASVGGFVCPIGQTAETALTLVTCLEEYATAAGLDGIEIRLPPSVYLEEPSDHLGFALMACGFQLSKRWLCHLIALRGKPELVTAQMTSSKRRDMSMGLRRGVVPRELPASEMERFYDLLLRTQAKHGSVPTHRLEELENLVRRVPGRLRLFLSEKEGRAIAGVLVLVLNRRVADVFYICQDEGCIGGLHPTTVLIAHVAGQMAREGYDYLDLGPTTFDDMSLNRGLAFFKEGFGGRGLCRDAWIWHRG